MGLWRKLIKKSTKDPNPPISNFYLLVHPYYDLLNSDQIQQFREIWMDSVNDASKDEESFAIMYFPGLGSDEDEPNKLRFRIDRPKKIELELARHVQKCFGRNRYKFVMVDNIYPYIIWTFDENVKLRISNPSETTITSRGVYAERCVNDGKLAAIEAYKVPKENASIIYSESIFGEQHIAERHGFSTHVRIF